MSPYEHVINPDQLTMWRNGPLWNNWQPCRHNRPSSSERSRSAFLTELGLCSLPLLTDRDGEQRALSRRRLPTMASRAKVNLPRLAEANVIGCYSWERMECYLDAHRCLYSRHGDVKTGTKL